MHAEMRPDCTEVMVANGVLLTGTGPRSRARAQALLHHEVGTHLVT